uniref:Centromere protein W n=1 Tax=Sphenodon punctatus TaxID=8508 RepID=A0A8D0G343_SPHPU
GYRLRLAPCRTLWSLMKQEKPCLDLAVDTDLLVHLNLFLHPLAEETRAEAFEDKSKIIKPEHALAVAKVILKKSRG